MKKVLYFFAFILAVTSITSIFFTNEVYAEEPVSTKVELTQENFNLTTLQDDSKTEFVLKENIVLTDWQPVENFNKIFDGNGFIIKTDAPIFENLLSNSIVKNLGVEIIEITETGDEGEEILGDEDEESLSDDVFTYETSANFGLIANNAYEALIEKCFVYGEINITLGESACVGGLVGYADKSIIRNCFSVVSLSVLQTSIEAEFTTVGGLVGASNCSTILFSYSAPYSEPTVKNLISVELDIDNEITKLIIGGLAGKIQGTTNAKIVNNFSGGAIVENYLTTSNKYIGTLFGEVEGFTPNNLKYCNVIDGANFSNTYGFVGTSYEESTFTKQPSSIFTSMSGFVITDINPTTNNLPWDEELQWNYDYSTLQSNTIWSEQTLASVNSPYIGLQVFQSFNLNIDTSYTEQGIGVNLKINKADGTPFDTPITSFKYGTTIQISLKVSEAYTVNGEEIDFRPYKKVGQLKKSGSEAIQEIVFTDETHRQATALITVTGATSGSYYAVSENIEYTLKVQSADETQGNIKVRQTNALSEYSIKYGDELTFTATPVAGGTYVFEKWIWQLGETTQDTAHSTNGRIIINFGGTNTDENITYINFDEEIPYDEMTGTFTLVASFSTNSKMLTIQSNTSKECCDIFVRGTQLTTITDYTEMYSNKEAVNVPIEITIIVREGFTFNYWQTGNGLSINNYIRTAEGETASSTTIFLKLKPEDLVIIANFTENEEEVQDLTWLWWTLGGVGGVGLITFITFLIIHKRRRESFISY